MFSDETNLAEDVVTWHDAGDSGKLAQLWRAAVHALPSQKSKESEALHGIDALYAVSGYEHGLSVLQRADTDRSSFAKRHKTS